MRSPLRTSSLRVLPASLPLSANTLPSRPPPPKAWMRPKSSTWRPPGSSLKSLSTQMTSRSTGTGLSSSTMSVPYMPRATCSKLDWCGWYQKVPESTAGNLYSKVSPTAIGSCVTCGTPSIALGTRRPCQCTVVPFEAGRLLVTATRARSPLRSRSTGPGTEPLKPHTLVLTPGRTGCMNALARSFTGVLAACAGGNAIIVRPAPAVLSRSRRVKVIPNSLCRLVNGRAARRSHSAARHSRSGLAACASSRIELDSGQTSSRAPIHAAPHVVPAHRCGAVRRIGAPRASAQA